MNPPPDDFDAQLEGLLRQPGPALPDAGFSTRVLSALPPPQPVASHWLGAHSLTRVCTVASLLGILAAVPIIALVSDGESAWAPVAATLTSLKSSLGDPIVAATLLLAIGCVLYALRTTPRRRRLSS
jgi:hypothetical protein